MRIGFAGTPDFARVALAELLARGFDVVAVLTQPDRPAGRGLKLQPSPVKALALERRIPVLQPAGLRVDGRYAEEAQTAREALQAAGAEALVVAAYGLLLPQWALDLPRLGCLNIHASLLPRWRGAAPIHRAIEAGDAQTGITIMQMDLGLDTGDMLRVQAEPIGCDDTTATLHDRLASLGGRLITEALDAASGGTAVRTPQPVDGVSYARKIDKSEAAIDWSASATLIERRVRAFDPFPGASFVCGGESLKLWRAVVVDGAGAPGTVLAGAPEPTIACGEHALRLVQVQRAGGRRVSAREFFAAGALKMGESVSLP